MSEPGRSARSFNELRVWKCALELGVECHSIARQFPRAESGPLRSQLLRAAISIPANIAEGNARSSRADYLRHLSIARGSLAELHTHLLIAQHVGYAARDRIAGALTLVDQCGRMLNALMKKLRESPKC